MKFKKTLSLRGWFAALLSFAAMAFVAGCGGGGGDAGTSPFPGGGGGGGGGGTSTVASIEVLSSSPQVGSGGDTVDITAIVKDSGNASLAATAVTFTADSGTLTDVVTTTDASGVATAKLSAGANKVTRVITVQVKSGDVTSNVQVAVTGTTLTVSGATTVALGGEETLSVKVTDSKGAGIAGVAVDVSSGLGNGLSATSLTTDPQGSASVVYTATKSGTDTITFSGAGDTETTSILISGEDFVFVSPAANTLIPVDTSRSVSVRYRSGGAPQAGRTVNFASTAGTLSASSAVTNASGVATVSVRSSTASPATLQATLQGGAAQATLPIEFVATVPASIVAQVTPAAVGPNAEGSTEQQAQVLATVRDANNNPVKGVTVNFSRLVDPSGGNLSQASAVTNSSGQATVQYISGPLTTSSNGVTIVTTVASNDTITDQATLTVNQSALFIALGTGNQISNYDLDTYQKTWTVYVTDANGIAVSNARLTVKLLPLKYGKGFLAWDGSSYARTGALLCQNEDLNYNGVLDAGEDFNGSDTLQPGNVVSVSPSTLTTNADGRGTIVLRYAESYVPWMEVRLRVEALVSGTESSNQADFELPGLATDFTNRTNPPAGLRSPFGIRACNLPG